MEVFAICVFVLMIGLSLGENQVTVSDDVYVWPTPNPLSDPKDRVDITISCTGSAVGLKSYIDGPIRWRFVSTVTGKVRNLSDSFYLDKDVVNNFAEKYSFAYHQTKNKTMLFEIIVQGVEYSDDGVYTCASFSGPTGDVIDSKNLTVNVMHPIQETSLKLSGKRTTLNASSILDADYSSHEIPAGQYSVICESRGSNPAPEMSTTYSTDSNTYGYFEDIQHSLIINGKIPKYDSHLSTAIHVKYTGKEQSVTCTSQIVHEGQVHSVETALLRFNVTKSSDGGKGGTGGADGSTSHFGAVFVALLLLFIESFNLT